MLSPNCEGWNSRFQAVLLLGAMMLCAFAGPVRGTWEPCTQQSECTAETCWDDLNAIDDGNKASDYDYFCRATDGVCVYTYKSRTDGGKLTVCQKDRPFALKLVLPCADPFTDCTPETCWNDINVIDDGNKPRDYSYWCQDGVCQKRFIGMWSVGSLTVCQRYSSASFEGDAVASGPSVTANSAGKMGGAKGMIVMMLIVIMMTSMLIF
jgi:hypothetical protein